jgi:hypothetical protein
MNRHFETPQELWKLIAVSHTTSSTTPAGGPPRINASSALIPPWERTFDPEHHPTDMAAYRRPSLRRLPPWAIELANGQRCVFLSGATYTVAGMRANYSCNAKGGGLVDQNTGWIVGAPSWSRPLWSVLYAPNQTAKTFEEVDVYVAWY